MIEDNEGDAELIRAFLEEGGFAPQIRRTYTEEDIRRALKEGPWDVIIADYVLPNFDGLRALALAKEWDSDTPFIMISGAMGEEFIVEAMRAGAQDFISKDHLVRLAPSINRELTETENRRARRRAEQALRESEKRFRAIVLEAPIPIMVHATDGRILHVSRAFTDLSGYTLEDAPTGKELLKLTRGLSDEEAEAVERDFLQMLRNAPDGYREEHTIRTKNGDNRHWLCYWTRLFDAPEEEVFIVTMSLDITERRKAEKALEDELKIRSTLNELYQPLISPSATMESIAAEVLTHARRLTDSPHGYVGAIDPETGDNIGYSLTEMLQGQCEVTRGRWRTIFPKGADGQYPGLWGQSLNTRQPFFTNAPSDFPQKASSPKGKARIDRFLSVPVTLGEELVGQIALVNKPGDYTGRDAEVVQRVAHYYAQAIQRVRNEDRIRASLKEKEVLLQEIHHRVKNNLAIIISLLNLQANKLRDDAVRAAFRDCQSRIRSMALIHETLYQSENLAELELGTYIRSLVRTLAGAYPETAWRLRFEIKADPINLPLDYTIPCGLILNELVSNSIKHAFPPGGQGEITVTAHERNDEIVLTVSDNGVGFPRDLDIKNSETLGMGLVVKLGEVQLRGKVELGADGGAQVIVRFKRPGTGYGRPSRNAN